MLRTGIPNMSQIETVAVKREGGQGYRIINKSDFDPKQHKLAKVPASDSAEGFDPLRNTSGTFSEPTPTDIRFPDKDLTEFENNHGAFLGRSAAELRAKLGLPDAPGGLAPDIDLLAGAAHDYAAQLTENTNLKAEVESLRSQLADANKAREADVEPYKGKTVPELKAIAEDRKIDLGDATKRDDIVAALQLADETK